MSLDIKLWSASCLFPGRGLLGQNFWHFFKSKVIIKKGVQMCGTYLNNKNSRKLEISVAEGVGGAIREDFIKEASGVWGSLWTMRCQSLMKEEFL